MAGAQVSPAPLAVAALILARGGGGEERQSAPPPTPWLDPHGEAPAVGSLALNPADNALGWRPTPACSAAR